MPSRNSVVHLNGEFVRKGREQLRLSQSEFVAKLKSLEQKNKQKPKVLEESGRPTDQAPVYTAVSLATLRQIEAGKRPGKRPRDGRPTRINHNSALAIAAVLGKPLEDLIVATASKEEPNQEHSPVPNGHPAKFSFMVSTLKDGQVIKSADLPLQVKGQYAGPPPAEFRVVLRDDYGNLYVQNPEVVFLPNGQWIATNVLPGHAITGVLFVQNNDAARCWFKDRVARKMWGAFRELPAGSEIITFVQVAVAEE